MYCEPIDLLKILNNLLTDRLRPNIKSSYVQLNFTDSHFDVLAQVDFLNEVDIYARFKVKYP